MIVISSPLTTSNSVKDIYIAENNKFAAVATSSGVELLDLLQGKVVSSGIIPGGFEPTCLVADWVSSSGLLYVGTSGGGIFSTRYHPIRGISDFSSNFQLLYSTSTPINISGDFIKDLDFQEGGLLIGTTAGVSFVYKDAAVANRSISGVNSVHLTSNGEIGYWTTISSIETSYDLPSTIGGGIINVDFEYTIASNPALPASSPTDIAIAEGVIRTLAFATPSGVLVVEELPFTESTAQRKTFIPINFFNESPAPTFISVDFSTPAGFSTGFLNTTTSGILFTFHLLNDTLSGTNAQQANDELYSNTRGQLMASGVLFQVRTTTVPQ